MAKHPVMYRSPSHVLLGARPVTPRPAVLRFGRDVGENLQSDDLLGLEPPA